MFPRVLPPAAPPISLGNLAHAIEGLFSPARQTRILEEELKSHFGVRHAFLASSGKACLVLILRALSSIHPRRKNVVIPAYTCFSVPAAIEASGLRTVPCDIDPRTLDFDYDQLAAMTDRDTLCVLPIHLFGIPSDMDRLRTLVKGKDVFLVEDAAQAMGGKVAGGWLGCLGDVGFFSFGRGKNISCVSGGVVLTNSDELGLRIGELYGDLPHPGIPAELLIGLEYLLMDIFIHPFLFRYLSRIRYLKIGESIYDTGFPVRRIGGVEAGLLRNWRGLLQCSNDKRMENAGIYRRYFGEDAAGGTNVAYLRFPVILPDKDLRRRILAKSSEKGLGMSGMYPVPVNEIREIAHRFPGESYPGAKEVSERILTLPTHPCLKKTDLKEIIDLVSSFTGGNAPATLPLRNEKALTGVAPS